MYHSHETGISVEIRHLGHHATIWQCGNEHSAIGITQHHGLWPARLDRLRPECMYASRNGQSRFSRTLLAGQRERGYCEYDAEYRNRHQQLDERNAAPALPASVPTASMSHPTAQDGWRRPPAATLRRSMLRVHRIRE